MPGVSILRLLMEVYLTQKYLTFFKFGLFIFLVSNVFFFFFENAKIKFLAIPPSHGKFSVAALMSECHFAHMCASWLAPKTWPQVWIRRDIDRARKSRRIISHFEDDLLVPMSGGETVGSVSWLRRTNID